MDKYLLQNCYVWGIYAKNQRRCDKSGGGAHCWLRAASIARASWSGHEVPRPRQSVHRNISATSVAGRLTASRLTPAVLPGHPPSNFTDVRIPFSSISKSMAFEQTPLVV